MKKKILILATLLLSSVTLASSRSANNKQNYICFHVNNNGIFTPVEGDGGNRPVEGDGGNRPVEGDGGNRPVEGDGGNRLIEVDRGSIQCMIKSQDR